MKLIALTIARNEAWTLGASVKASLRWCDEVVIMDHCSTDNTAAICGALQRRFPGRVHLLHETDPVWHEMRYRQATLECARAHGATHCAIVDADEMLTENLVESVRGMASSILPGQIMQLPWLCLWRSMHQFRYDNSVWARSFVSWIFRDSPDLHWITRNGYDFHHRHPMGSVERKMGNILGGGVLHYQHASWRRLLAKQALYKMIETERWGGTPGFSVAEINQKYDGTVNEQGIGYLPVKAEWIPPELAQVDVEAEPWQETECRLKFQADPAKFAGLNLYGVVG